MCLFFIDGLNVDSIFSMVVGLLVGILLLVVYIGSDVFSVVMYSVLFFW